eukprot:TRINITY_DN1274_c1_g1_i3.p1 TRINITY_DN1274_c1_g1~~TRINITY_DN1274_c1_g1_i3.p1  ORF type:complete len:139 (+),score=26.99 TRINITY_DN1274_c1_g1_i3:1121-1537(+)
MSRSSGHHTAPDTVPQPSISHPDRDDAPLVTIDVGGRVSSTSVDAIHVGDIITSADGQPIIHQRDLATVLSESLSHVVVCKVRRNNNIRTVEVKVPAAAPAPAPATRKSVKRTAPKSSSTNAQSVPLKKKTRQSIAAR